MHYVIMGAWGDVLSTFGNIRKITKDPIKLFYFGMIPEIKNFLELQENVISVDAVIATEQEYLNFVMKPNWSLFHEHFIDVNVDINSTEINLTKFNIPRYKIPEQPYILFQPFSTQSVSPCDHWVFWFNALEWLSETGINTIVVGEKQGGIRGRGFEFPDICMPHIHDWTGKTSMCEILHLARHSKAILSTSNSLAIWSVLENIPSVIVRNRTNHLYPHYREWTSRNRFCLEYSASFDRFKKCVLEVI